MKFTGRQQKLVFVAAFVVIVIVSALSFRSSQALIHLSANVERSQLVLLDLHRMFSHLKDVESSARGFALTGDDIHLHSFEQGVARLEADVGRLRAQQGATAIPAGRIDTLERLANQRVAYSRSLVQGRRRTPQPALFNADINGGTEVMERIRGEVEAIIEAERTDYRERSLALEEQGRRSGLIMIAGILLSLAAFVWLFTLRNTELVRRRAAEEELRGLNAQLEDRVADRTREVERSRALLDAVVENLPDMVFLKDGSDGFRYVLVNGAGERLLGRDRDELIGQIDHELFPRGEAALCLEEDRKVAETGEVMEVAERRVSTHAGVRVVESRKVPVALDGVGQSYVLGIVRDVTERRSLETQVREMQRMEAVGRLTGGVAHDFNNLLAIIMGSLELVRDQLAPSSEPAVIVDEALDAAGRGAELVRRLLAFARKQHLDPLPVDLSQRLPSIIPLLQRTLGEDVRVDVRLSNGLWSALVDPTQVDDALVNLAINARDAMPAGGALTIETSNVVIDEDYAAQHIEVTPGEYVMLAVSDTGSGMAPEVLQRAFEPFFTTKPEGKGTGLGLSQIYGWVKQSGGHIKIYSEVGHGTAIKLYLPRAPASAEAAPATPADKAPAGGHERILVVEDNPNVRRTVLRQLRDLGFDPIEAEDGKSALAIVDQGEAIDLMLTDVVMPGGMSGYDLAEAVAKRRPEIRTLFTSGYTELAETSRGHRNGPLISKPYRKQDLGRTIRALLDKGEET